TSAHTVHDINKLLYPFIPPFTTMPNLHSVFIYPFYHIPLNVPDPTHILPILAALATFVQLRMSQPKTQPGATPDATQTQMKLMQYITPLMAGVVGWNYAAGLALYWTESSGVANLQQYLGTGTVAL